MTIAALVAVRKNSQRCKNKMLRPFMDTTLVDISLERLGKLKGFDAQYFSANEKDFLDKAEKYPVKVIERTVESVNIDGPLNKIHGYLSDIPEDYIMWINACHAFLSVETIEGALQHFKEHKCKSMTSVIMSRNWYYTLDGKPINNLDPRCISTKSSPPVYGVAHAFHIFERAYLLEHNAYWRGEVNDPCLFEIPEEEAIEADTELEFRFAEMLYREQRGK